jgi:polysaccharide biosynthesis protein PslG
MSRIQRIRQEVLSLNRLFSLIALVAVLTALIPSSSPVQAQASSPDYGASVFLLGNPETTARDIALVKKANLNWIKMAVPWRSIEPSCKNCIDWDDLDRVVLAASQAGLKILARVDHQPAWSRVTPVDNGPPDDVYDYADFVSVMARRYKDGSAKGTIQAIEVWNEPNLSREWGGATIDAEQAAQYMFMLKQTYQLVKAEDPTKIIVSAGLSPTGTNDGTALPDDEYLKLLYANGLAQYSDAIGVHGAGYGSAPEVELKSNPAFPHESFYFRRIEQLRETATPASRSGCWSSAGRPIRSTRNTPGTP